jgi:hypothetical protein
MARHPGGPPGWHRAALRVATIAVLLNTPRVRAQPDANARVVTAATKPAQPAAAPFSAHGGGRASNGDDAAAEAGAAELSTVAAQVPRRQQQATAAAPSVSGADKIAGGGSDGHRARNSNPYTGDTPPAGRATAPAQARDGEVYDARLAVEIPSPPPPSKKRVGDARDATGTAEDAISEGMAAEPAIEAALAPAAGPNVEPNEGAAAGGGGQVVETSAGAAVAAGNAVVALDAVDEEVNTVEDGAADLRKSVEESASTSAGEGLGAATERAGPPSTAQSDDPSGGKRPGVGVAVKTVLAAAQALATVNKQMGTTAAGERVLLPPPTPRPDGEGGPIAAEVRRRAAARAGGLRLLGYDELGHPVYDEAGGRRPKWETQQKQPLEPHAVQFARFRDKHWGQGRGAKFPRRRTEL